VRHHLLVDDDGDGRRELVTIVRERRCAGFVTVTGMLRIDLGEMIEIRPHVAGERRR